MSEYINISMLNDFVFCPYSIYLHNVYTDKDETIYHAPPQTRGRIAHKSTDEKSGSHSANDILALSVYSEEYGLMGKIDLYKKKEKRLIERKYLLKQIFQGQRYQLWGEMLCLREMGYEVKELFFYETSTNTMIPEALPNDKDIDELKDFLQRFRTFDPSQTPFSTNINKCFHCIYCNLCDKTSIDNVYT